MTGPDLHAGLRYSRGRSLVDARPAQRTAADFVDFIAQLDADRSPTKEGAAYICGPLNGDGRRCKTGTLPRAWVAVDLDRIDAAALPDVVRWFGRYSAACWPTHSSTLDSPRLRVIVELDRPASRDQCIAIGVQMEAKLRDAFGDAVFLDLCTFRPEQPVLVPPTGAVIQRLDGTPLRAPAELLPDAVEPDICTEVDRRIPKASSVSSVRFCVSSVQTGTVLVGGTTWRIPPDTIPTEVGQRNDRLFSLARHVKAMRPAPTPDELRCIVRAWHVQATPAIGTLGFTVSLAEFMSAFDRVKQPHGATMGAIIGSIDNIPLPGGIDRLGYEAAGNLLVRICAALQAHEGAGVFFLGARQAGELVGVPFTDANRMMQTLRLDGVIELVTKGAGKKASRYRFVWSAAPGGAAVATPEAPA